MIAIARRLAVRVANRRDRRLILLDYLDAIQPGSRSSYLWNCDEAYLAHERRALVEELLSAVRDVAQMAFAPETCALMRMTAAIEYRTVGQEERIIKSWIEATRCTGIDAHILVRDASRSLESHFGM